MRKSLLLMLCVWILWHYGEAKTESGSTEKWTPMLTYERKESCEWKAKALVEEKLKENPGIQKKKPNVVVLVAEGNVETHSLRCFPSEVDPRAKPHY